VYGLSMISGLMNAMNIEYGLLLAGDTLSHLLSPTDRTTRPIFSDAGSATLLFRETDAKPIHFNLGADGKGFDIIHVKDGGARNPFNINSLRMKLESPGIERAGVHLVMEGIDVMNYALKYVVPNVQTSLQIPGWDSESIDYFIFHQANKILNESLRRQLQLPPDKVPESLSAFGNTSCCTIPVTIAHCLEQRLQEKPLKLLLCGFGAGFSWGTALVETKPGMICPQPKQINSYGR
jgi:3-oxoacyl-[acyl-carrier-protein] synthase-3